MFRGKEKGMILSIVPCSCYLHHSSISSLKYLNYSLETLYAEIFANSPTTSRIIHPSETSELTTWFAFPPQIGGCHLYKVLILISLLHQCYKLWQN